MEKQIVVYLYNGRQLKDKEESTVDGDNNVNGPQNNPAEEKKTERGHTVLFRLHKILENATHL